MCLVCSEFGVVGLGGVESIMEGWLMKQGLVSKSFKRRYMRLDGHQIFYSTDPFQPPKGVIDLRGGVCKTRQQFGG